MAASGKEGSILDCPICLEKFRNPKYLPCLHTFCELCIESFIDSSISDCVQKKKTISFDCPVCRLAIPSPAKNISAKTWAEQLPINHQLLAISESYQKQTEVLCDSCRQNDEKVIATIRCQQCRENLCKACCKFIHERVKAFGLHTFIDLRSTDAEIDNTVELGNCLVHTDKPIEVYCLNHEKLGCIYCLTTVHKECKIVLSLDEIDEKDLENFSESVINETKEMRDLTSYNILDTKKNLADLNQEKNEVLENVAKNIEHIKQRLDYLHSKFQNSLRSTYEKETSDLSFVLKTLEDFDTTLAQNENIASTFMQRGSKKQIFIAMEKIKLRISDNLERMTTKTNDFKRSKVKWTYIDVVESLNELTKLGNLECIIERFDFITPIKKHFNAMEKDGNLREIAKENKKQCQKIAVPAPDSHRPSNVREIQESDHGLNTYYYGGMTLSNDLLVAAIDLGNTFSGYAFATRADVNDDPLRSHTPHWYASNSTLISSKTPSTVLLNKREQLVAFGYEAESKYAELLENEEGENYYYFPKFKMMLYDHVKIKRLTRDTMISDIRGRELLARTVFACAIRYLKDHLLKELEMKYRGDFKTSEINWVLTVPAFWDENAKMFMREAAQKGGISSSQLLIALEPEAATIYCRHKLQEDTNTIGVFKPGSKYLYLDAGGGTVDISVHEVKKNRDIKELDRLTNGEWGGSSVDTAFKSVLGEIATKEMIENYSRKYPDDYLSLFEDFEKNKRSCRKGQVCTLKIPVSFEEECSNTLGTDVNILINNSEYKDTFILRRDKMRIKSFETFFQSACRGIIKLLDELFQSPKLKDVNKILMVGGFSESCLFQEALRDAFPTCQLVVPEEPGLAVLRGAVVFGFYPRTESCRISRHTYGVDMDARFDPAVHEESKKEVIDGVEYCTGLFDKLIGKGEKLFDGKESGLKYYIPMTPQQNFVSFCIFSSDDSDPLYTDQCIRLGKTQQCLSNQEISMKGNKGTFKMESLSEEMCEGMQHMSESVFVGLCKIVGTSAQVAMRRETVDIKEMLERRVTASYAYIEMMSGSNREGFRLKESDVDVMLWPNNHRVILEMSQFQYYNTANTTLILSDSSESPPGFTLLQLLTQTTYREVKSACVRMNDRTYIFSSKYRELTCLATLPNSVVHGPCGSGDIGEEVEYDTAFCFVSDVWPPSASSWKDRCHSWPDPEVVDDIVRSGCHFVAIGHPLGPHGNEEWRISFSQAENRCVYAMNHCQFLTYGLLKLFLKEVVNQQSEETNKLLCSYHMKTTIFWAIQQNTLSHWCPQNLLAGFWVCFKLLLKWVYEGICPNFFIPQNNLFLTKVHGSAQNRLFLQLHELYKKGLACLLQSSSIRSYIIDVLYNPRLPIITDESVLRCEIDYDLEFFLEMSCNDNVKSNSLYSCMKHLAELEHRICSPLTEYKVLMLQKLKATILQRTAFILHINKGVNKQIYITDKLSCHMITLAAKLGCVSDMLYIAMYYYKTLRYREALSVIKMTETKLVHPCLIYRRHVDTESYTEAVGGKSWATKMRQAMAGDIKLYSTTSYISELIPEQQSALQNRVPALYIPVFVMLLFLEFLCYRHIDTTLSQATLDKLHLLVHLDQGLYVRDIFRDISWEILGICQQITGNAKTALYSYQQSMSTRYPIHQIQNATQKRIQELR